MEPELGTNLIERLNGPFSLRLLLQPTMALLFAMRDGHKDAKEGAQPYLQALLNQQTDGRRETLSSAWASLSKVMIIAFVLDCAFQYATAGSVALLEAIGMAFLLCAVPYTLFRGPVTRVFSNR
ncbi:hypothetical protein C8N36_113134 [Pelagimonas varians]|uniref:Uncharacterized protein n=1 Tax=Pelagimonas varians TaxID=696760 RepID=A0A238KV67_9RHOB|nr:hypothetical protein C8N36_113134 [Pelagimonas varians]SMX46733.1 hypothetical protein PEV8663_03368 [Pelagimonas varians]